MTEQKEAARLVLLDRDGVLNQLCRDPRTALPAPPCDPADVELIPEAAKGLRKLAGSGFRLAVVSNQPDAAKCKQSAESLDRVGARVLGLLRAEGVGLDDVYECRHHPDGTAAGLSGPCGCRKPAPGMLLAAMAEFGAEPDTTVMVGDGVADVLAASAAGVASVLIAPDQLYVHHELRRRGANPSLIVPDFAAAVEAVTRLAKRSTRQSEPDEGFAGRYLDEVMGIAARIPLDAIDALVDAVRTVQLGRGRIFFAGVGGSAGNAGHAAADFRKFLKVEAHSISDNVSDLTARINDKGWDTCYSDSLEAVRFGPGDLLFVLSVGGGSRSQGVSVNLVVAAEYAHAAGGAVVGVVGRDGGDIRHCADALVIVPSVEPARVTPHTEGMQAVLLHLLACHPRLTATQGRWESLDSAGGSHAPDA